MSIKFIHNKTMHYRVPFFSRIADRYDVDFLFTHTDDPDGLSPERYETLGRDPSFILTLAKEVLDDDCDIVVNGEPGGLTSVLWTIFVFIVAKASGKQHVMWSERYEPPEWSLRFVIMDYIYRVIIPRSEACFVPGVQHKEYMHSLGADPENVFLVPNVSNLTEVDADEAGEDALQSEFGVEDKRVVLFVGRMDRAKGIQYLIPAFDRLHQQRDDIALVIVGTGYYGSQIRELYQEYETPDVHFAGWIDNEELPDYYAMADLFVHPSIQLVSRRGGSIGDTYGLVFNEAAHFGLPIIGTDAVGAAEDVIRDGENGYVVPQRDVDTLSEKMGRVLSDDALRERMGQRSREIVANGRRYEHMVEGFDAVVDSVDRQ